MKYSKYLILIITVVLLGACQKNELVAPAFDAGSEIPFWDSHYYAQKIAT